MIVSIPGLVSENTNLPVCRYVPDCDENSFHMGKIVAFDAVNAIVNFPSWSEEIAISDLKMATRTDTDFDHIVSPRQGLVLN